VAAAGDAGLAVVAFGASDFAGAVDWADAVSAVAVNARAISADITLLMSFSNGYQFD
jgi:hypothetical protein